MGRIRWRWVLAVAASAGIVTTMAGAHGGSPALIHACVNKVTKVVRIVGPTAKCKRTERAVDWPAQTAVGVQGVQGPQGPPGAPGAPGQPGQDGADGAPGISWQGAWNVATAYDVGDGVFHQGSSYIAIAESTGEAPGTGASWGLLAQRGSDGRDGEPGLSWQGPWDENNTYRLGDAVEHNGSSWVFIGSGRSGEPGVDFSDWQLVAQKGDPGPTGVPPAPNQLVVGSVVAPWGGMGTDQLPIRGLELATTVTPISADEVSVEHTFKVTREIDSRSPLFMSSALQGLVQEQDNLDVRLVATGEIDPYVRYRDFDNVEVTGVEHRAGTRNLETLTLHPFDTAPSSIDFGHPSLRPPAGGTRVGTLRFDGSTVFDILAADWRLAEDASGAHPLEVVRRLSDDTSTRFASFLTRTVYPSVEVELFTPGTSTVAMRYTLTNAWIQTWVTAVDGAANVLPTEKLTIRYTRFKQETLDPAAEFCWDFGAFGDGAECP